MKSETEDPLDEYLTFWLGEEYYAIDILTVQEIRIYEHVTPIANMPDFIKGVMNLRGIVIPIIDMRIKFHLSNIIYNEMTVVIILTIGERVIGIVVDSVSEVVSLSNTDIQSPPKFSGALDLKYIKGLATINEQMLILIKIAKLINSKEMLLFDHLTDNIEE